MKTRGGKWVERPPRTAAARLARNIWMNAKSPYYAVLQYVAMFTGELCSWTHFIRAGILDYWLAVQFYRRRQWCTSQY